LVYSTVTNEDFVLNNMDVGETEHFIDILRAVKGVKVAAIFKEVTPTETKVSLRSTDGLNVAKIAEKFGGGGHAAASGYSSKKSLKEAINDLVKLVNGWNSSS
jgi:phosphoesterase RecJ-like protein